MLINNQHERERYKFWKFHTREKFNTHRHVRDQDMQRIAPTCFTHSLLRPTLSLNLTAATYNVSLGIHPWNYLRRALSRKFRQQISRILAEDYQDEILIITRPDSFTTIFTDWRHQDSKFFSKNASHSHALNSTTKSRVNLSMFKIRSWMMSWVSLQIKDKRPIAWTLDSRANRDFQASPNQSQYHPIGRKIHACLRFRSRLGELNELPNSNSAQASQQGKFK